MAQTFEILDRDQREQGAGAAAAVFLVEEEPEQLVLAEELDDVPRELVGLVDLGRTGRDPVASKCPDELADLPLLLGQGIPGHARSLWPRYRGTSRDAGMEPETQHVWITTRRLKPGTREEFRKAWRPARFPRMLSAHEYWAEDRDEVVGISVWESPQARDSTGSEVEAERRRDGAVRRGALRLLRRPGALIPRE